MVTLDPKKAARIGIRKLNCFVTVTRDLVLPCGVVGQGDVGAPPNVSHVTLISLATTVTPDPRDSAAIAQPILFVEGGGAVQVPVYEDGSLAATIAPARAAFSTVTWA